MSEQHKGGSRDVDQISQFLVHEIRELKGDRTLKLDVQQNWYELGMDSVEIAGLAVAVEKEYGLEIDEEVMVNANSITALANHVEKINIEW